MATKRQSMLNWASRPDLSEKVWFEPSSVQLDDDGTFQGLVLVFKQADDSKNAFHGRFSVPQDYDSAAKFIIYWTNSSSTTDDAVFDMSYLTVGEGEDLDQDELRDSISVTSAATAKGQLVKAEITATDDDDFAVGDEVPFILYRDQTDADGNDDLAADVLVVGIYFEYSDGT